MSSPAPPTERRLLAVALRCCSATCFAGMGGMLKMAGERGATAGEFVFFRSVGAFPVIAVWILLGGGLAAIRVRNPRAHLTRSIIGLVSMVFTLTAVALLPLPQATTLTYSAPILATVMSGILLGEAIGPRRWAAVVVGFLGVLMVTDPFNDSIPVLGLAVGMAAAIGQAAVMITLRQIGQTETSSSIVFFFTVFTSLVSAPAMLFFARPHDPATYALLVGAGLSAGFGQITMTRSLRFAPVSVVVPFDYLQILWAVLIGWVILASPPSWAMLAGAAVIAGSGIYTAYRESRRGQQPSQALSVPEA